MFHGFPFFHLRRPTPRDTTPKKSVSLGVRLRFGAVGLALILLAAALFVDTTTAIILGSGAFVLLVGTLISVWPW